MKSIPATYEKSLDIICSRLRKLAAQVNTARILARTGRIPESYRAAFEAEETAEKMTLLLRSAPAYTGNPLAGNDLEQVLRETVPVHMGYTRRGWFWMTIPCLLPKKEKGSVDYIRGFLRPALNVYFEEKTVQKFSDCVLIYRHVYDRSIPERRWRDHDNIELNCVTDLVAQRVMQDDTPGCCRHYYCSAPGPESQTQVYVVPTEEFPLWLSMEPNIPEEGPSAMDPAPKTGEYFGGKQAQKESAHVP